MVSEATAEASSRKMQSLLMNGDNGGVRLSYCRWSRFLSVAHLKNLIHRPEGVEGGVLRTQLSLSGPLPQLKLCFRQVALGGQSQSAFRVPSLEPSAELSKFRYFLPAPRLST